MTTQAGGGVYLGERIADGNPNSPKVLFFNCRFVDNLVRGNGSALYLLETGQTNSRVGIQYSTFAYNVVLDTADTTGGGAIYVSGTTTTPSGLTSSIVYPNATLSSGNPIAGPGATTSGSTFQSDRLLVGFSDVTYGGGTYPWPTGAPNINSDPLFVNGAFRDLRLQATPVLSPCADTAGSSAGIPVDYPDMNLLNGSSDKVPYELITPLPRVSANGLPDMGCHEI